GFAHPIRIDLNEAFAMARALTLMTMMIALPALAAVPAAADPTVVGIEAIGTAFRVTLSDGSVKEGKALAGAGLGFAGNGTPLRVSIAAIEPDAGNEAVLLHDFRIDGSDVALCEAGPDGKRMGFPLAGRSTADGRLVVAEPGAFELICTSGAQGKCVRFG